ncbi:MAG: hypothetical protein J2P55_06580 [Rhizobiales bacterium]|nr:hypothetical protein [Hyphomicrobiales bacterium]
MTLPCANAECQGKFRCCRRFDVGTDTWHSTGPVGPQVHTRDSILLRYFVDGGMLRFLRNRGKRFGNYLLNEARNRLP